MHETILPKISDDRELGDASVTARRPPVRHLRPPSLPLSFSLASVRYIEATPSADVAEPPLERGFPVTSPHRHFTLVTSSEPRPPRPPRPPPTATIGRVPLSPRGIFSVPLTRLLSKEFAYSSFRSNGGCPLIQLHPWAVRRFRSSHVGSVSLLPGVSSDTMTPDIRLNYSLVCVRGATESTTTTRQPSESLLYSREIRKAQRARAQARASDR